MMLNFSKEGMLNRHALRYLGRTLLCIVRTYVAPVYVCTYVRTYVRMCVLHLLLDVCRLWRSFTTYVRTYVCITSPAPCV